MVFRKSLHHNNNSRRIWNCAWDNSRTGVLAAGIYLTVMKVIKKDLPLC